MNEGYLKYFGVLFCLFAIAAILPAASAKIPFVNITPLYGACYSESGTGCPMENLIDGNTNDLTNWLTLSGGSNNGVRMYLGGVYHISSCSLVGHGTTLGRNVSYTFSYLDSTFGAGNKTGEPVLTNGTSVSTSFPLGNDTSWLNVREVVDTGWFSWTELTCYGYNSTWSDFYPPLANFTATPTSGTGPLTVSFSDTSTNITGGETWNWSVSPAPGVSINTPSAQNTIMTFGTIGNYTITHGVSNPMGSSIATKTDYIYVYNSTSQTTLHVTAINALNAYPIHGAQVNLYDVQNNSWSNTTTTDGTGTITALSSHTVNAYASSAGFSDGDKLGIPVSNVYDSILLFPANATSVSAGNVTLFVSVFDSNDHSKPIVGAGVTVVSTTGAQGQFTNSGGIAQFAVPNKTTVWVDAQATGQGYLGATQSVYTGTGSGGSASVTVTIYLSKRTVTPTPVITTLPGGGYPTTQPTLLDGCEEPMSAECQASQNEYSMGWLSQNGLLLIQFFIICFIVFMLKGMGR